MDWDSLSGFEGKREEKYPGKSLKGEKTGGKVRIKGETHQ